MKTLYFSVKLHTIVLYRNTQQDQLDIVIPANAGNYFNELLASQYSLLLRGTSANHDSAWFEQYFKKRTENTHAYGQTFIGLWPRLPYFSTFSPLLWKLRTCPMPEIIVAVRQLRLGLHRGFWPRFAITGVGFPTVHRCPFAGRPIRMFTAWYRLATYTIPYIAMGLGNY
ncbi:hypothetical protein [Maribacter sp. 2307UL18-2]|uniref:hypothetical protein n=1 Tax=Maribacter sp. 2307UL18-2 TaxID=3386274 RepID=UPI0039BCBE40